MQQISAFVEDAPGIYQMFQYMHEEDEVVFAALKLIEEEPSISILVLAAGTGPEGPGPLISYLAGKPAARLRIPITIIPGGLSLDEVDALS